MKDEEAKPSRVLLRSRWVRRTLREVWLVDGAVIEKRFVHHTGRRDRRPVWKWEDRALRRLEGLPVPRSLGWTRVPDPAGPCITLRRTYLAGHPLPAATPADLQDLGRLLANLHARLVVNNDPSWSNFIRTPGSELACLDFGRSRTFLWRSPAFYFYVGKEWARLFQNLNRDPALWQAFASSYRHHAGPGGLFHRIRDWSFRYWSNCWKHRLPGARVLEVA